MKIYCPYCKDNVPRPVLEEDKWIKTDGIYDKRFVPEIRSDFTRNIQYIEDDQLDGTVLIRWEYWLRTYYVEIGSTEQELIDFLSECGGLGIVERDGCLHLEWLGD